MPKNHSQNTDLIQLQKMVMIRQVSAGIAREIRNPLSVIKTMLFAMRSDIASENPMCSDFEVVNKEIHRMEHSVQRFIDYTWPTDLILSPVNLSQIVTNAMGKLIHQAQNQGVHIETEVNLDVMILADQVQMEQVFVYLVLNALQAMPEGGKLCIAANTKQVFINLALNVLSLTSGKIEPSRLAKNGKTEQGKGSDVGGVEIGVSDTGEGIPEDIIGQIFDPFVIEGSEEQGLNLAIAQQIVERHGGRISAQNRPKGGATFTVTLPICVSTESESV